MANQKVQSFEVSEADAVGDLVSRDRKSASRRLRVGLLPLGWFEWWPMFPESDLEARIKADADRFLSEMKSRFGAQHDLVMPGSLVDTLDGAHDAGRLFHEQGVDLVVLAEMTYLTDFIPLEALDQVPNVPVLIYATQATNDLWSTMGNLDVIRYEGLVGNAQLVGAFRKMGRPYRVVVGALEDPQSFDDIGMHLRTTELVRSLRSMDIGLLGHTFRGMYDIEIDKTKVKGVFGPNVLYLDVTHLLSIWERIDDQAVTAFLQDLDARIPIPMWGIDEEDRRKSARLGLAVQGLVRRFNLDALTLLGQHHVEVATRASADFSFYCVESDGVMTTHEGDIANLVMKYILHQLTDSLPVFLEWTAFDKTHDTLLLTHHGVVDPVRMATGLDRCRWTPSPEKWDFTGSGMSCEYTAKAGRVTLASLINEVGTWKMLISEGECVDLPTAPCFAPQFHFRPASGDVVGYVSAILREGVAHHVCLAYGDWKRHLVLMADHFGIPAVVI